MKVDGKRVALGEVEGCLESFPKIKAAQARVITDDLGGPMVVARVVRASMCRAEDIIDHCARNLAPYKVPRQIEFCEEILSQPGLPRSVPASFASSSSSGIPSSATGIIGASAAAASAITARAPNGTNRSATRSARAASR